MHSIRTRITFMTVTAMIIVMIIASVFGVITIRNMGNAHANQLLLLLCETGEKNLDMYLRSVEQSVEMVSAYVESDLDGLEDEKLQAHLDRVSDIFKRLSYQTFGVLTYYYRIDPEVSAKAKGFWYVNQDGSGFQEHEVTDITLYDTEDTSALVWFTVPKYKGESVWLPPYITDNLGALVVSYNVPVYLGDRFVGVIGIEIDHSTLDEQVDNITLYENGYAFVNDADGHIVYHPHIPYEELVKNHPKVPAGLLSEDKFITYTFNGVKKQAVWLSLSNGMRLNVTVPVSEINADWQRWGIEIVAIFAVLLLIFVIVIARYTQHITKPLLDITHVAEQVNKGHYDFTLDYDGDDEVGILTRAFSHLLSYLKDYIKDLNDLAYADSLTHVRNKGAFSIHLQNIQKMIADRETPPKFAIIIFDCDDLKSVNDKYGHDKGDIYLKNACSLICEVFKRSSVFRIGGDEFATILMNNDFENREELVVMFNDISAEMNTIAKEPWERIDVALGMAVYDPAIDNTPGDVVKRADQLMYENKRERKNS